RSTTRAGSAAWAGNPLSPHLRLASRQLLPLVAICRRHVDVEGPKWAGPRVADFMPLATSDKHEGALSQFDPLSFHHRHSRAAFDVKPLVRSPVAVVRTSLNVARCQRHLGRLAVLVAHHDSESVSELEMLVLHENLPHDDGRRTMSSAKSGCLSGHLVRR